MTQKTTYKCCGNIGQKADACIIRGPKLFPPSLRKKLNQSNALHGEEPNEPPREWNIQPPQSHFKSRTSPPDNIPALSYIMVRLNHHAINNGNVEVHPSEFPVEFNSESVPYPYTTRITSIDDDKMNHLLELFHSEHDMDLLDIYLNILQT